PRMGAEDAPRETGRPPARRAPPRAADLRTRGRKCAIAAAALTAAASKAGTTLLQARRPRPVRIGTDRLETSRGSGVSRCKLRDGPAGRWSRLREYRTREWLSWPPRRSPN